MQGEQEEVVLLGGQVAERAEECRRPRPPPQRADIDVERHGPRRRTPMRLHGQRLRAKQNVFARVPAQCDDTVRSKPILMLEARFDQTGENVRHIVRVDHQIQVEARPQRGISIGIAREQWTFERHCGQTAVGQQVQQFRQLRFGTERIQPHAVAIDRQNFADFVREFVAPAREQRRCQQTRHVVLFSGGEQTVERWQCRRLRYRWYGTRIP